MIELVELNELAEMIPPKCRLAIPADYSGVAMALTRAIIRHRVHGLELLCVPTSAMQADLLIGAGCVAAIETSAVTMGELGRAPCFSRAVERGEIVILDSTCPAVHAALQASEKGIPFIPLRGLIGSDVQRRRTDWQIIQNP
ncbi:MAG: CoA synthetase, partial [Pseudomonadota bacterium]